MRDCAPASVAKTLVRALLALLLGHRGLMAGDAVVEGEALVTFKQHIAAAGAGAALERQALRMAETYDRIARHDRQLAGLVRAKGRSTSQLIAMLKADPNVETAEPNFIRRIAVNPPDDSHFSKLWGLQNTGQTVDGTPGTPGVDTNFLAAWKLARPGGGEVVVGVIDTGVNLSHPDLAANVWINPGEIAGNGIDDDGNGYLDDVNGYDFAVGTPQLSDSADHGTHVAGTIAAVGKNHAGVIGINPRAKILALKVSSDGATMATSALLAAYNYAITLKQNGVNIV
ncbi:S8 family serine peptidase, partial [bacterium]|nr:S8 family serine peptidase [bacterium]